MFHVDIICYTNTNILAKDFQYFLLIFFLENGTQPACMPRPEIYTIPSVDGMLMTPMCLSNVSRCGGCCTDPWTECVADKQTNKSVSVYVYKRYSESLELI